MIKIYERLSQVYDSHWGDFSGQYIDWINRLLIERGVVQGKILDLACGTGTLALGLAHFGHIVHGIDISVEMIERARVKSAGLSNISFDIQDMVQFKADGMFNLVVCSFDSINYLRKSNHVRKMLSRVASTLDENGLFIFDSNTKIMYQSYSKETIILELDGQAVIQHCRYDSVRKEAMTMFSFLDGTYEIHRQRPYDYDEILPFLIAAELYTVCLFSWFDVIPYTSKTAKLFCVAEKRRKCAISQ
ncbi:class I SAM-dependent DNA methyltransferase [Chloroflexota bacterium]